MNEGESRTAKVTDVLKEPESLERSIRSIRRYGESPDGSSSKQQHRLGTIHHLANEVADEVESLELSNVMSDEELDRVEKVMRISTWGILVSMRLLTEEVVENSNSE